MSKAIVSKQIVMAIMVFSCWSSIAWAEPQPDSALTEPAVNQSEAVPVPAAEIKAKPDDQPTWPFGDGFPEATGLAFQPPYVLVKLGIAAVGGVVSGLTWVATAGRDEPAKTIWTSTTSGPWTWHGWLKGEKEQQ
jgi:hypothetical protein